MNSEPFNILFVCSGNSCRSPIAEGLLKAKLAADFKDNVVVQSAGTLGINGNPATEYAIHVTDELGGDIEQHRSQGLTEELVREADIIFCMAPEHEKYIVSLIPEVRENVFLLRSFARGSEEKFTEKIEDPIGASLEVYQQCGEFIDEELDRILPTLKKLIAAKVG